MPFHRPFALLVLSALLLAPAAQAGDNAAISVLGFSPDGKTFAFEQFGTHDGSGFPYSTLYFIDVATNAWSTRPIGMDGEDEMMDMPESDDLDASLEGLRHRLRVSAMNTFRTLGLTSATGTALFENYVSDYAMGDEQLNPAQLRCTLGGHACTLRVSERPDPAASADEAWMGTPMLLTVELHDEVDGTVTVLQKDERLPASRGNATAYDVSGLWISEDGQGLAVLVGYLCPGFEGPSKRYLAVTASLR